MLLAHVKSSLDLYILQHQVTLRPGRTYFVSKQVTRWFRQWDVSCLSLDSKERTSMKVGSLRILSLPNGLFIQTIFFCHILWKHLGLFLIWYSCNCMNITKHLFDTKLQLLLHLIRNNYLWMETDTMYNWCTNSTLSCLWCCFIGS